MRNPLAALRTYAKLLLRRLGPESTHRSLIESLLSEQDQLNRYISALDELSQVKLPASDGAPAPLLLPPVVSPGPSLTIKTLLNPLIDRAAATAHLQGREWFSPSNWPSWTNEPRDVSDGVVAEIVANLLENAFRYSPSQASIGIEVTEEGICVWDEGTPINEEEREKIIEKGC